MPPTTSSCFDGGHSQLFLGGRKDQVADGPTGRAELCRIHGLKAHPVFMEHLSTYGTLKHYGATTFQPADHEEGRAVDLG